MATGSNGMVSLSYPLHGIIEYIGGLRLVNILICFNPAGVDNFSDEFLIGRSCQQK